MSTTALLLLSVASFNATPEATSRGVLYDFSATWCGPCQQMSPIVARLEREGLPVRKIDVDQQPELAQRYGVRPIPAFVLVVDGKVIDREVGVTSEARLRQMLAMIPPADKPPEKQREIRVQGATTVADGKSSKSATKSIFQLPSLPPLFRKKREVSIDDPLTSAAADAEAVIRANSDDREAKPAAPRPTGPLPASTRIRVKDKEGINFGSGTVIESRAGRTIILTCGHIFRQLKKDSTIEVDLFDGERVEPYVATLIDFDSESDVGLIAIPTASEVSAVKIAPVGGGVRKADQVTCIGCGGGDPPTEQKQKVTALNRYLGPSNIECTGVPIQGRSGGGLFNTAGEIIGVCIAADQKDQRGIYSGLSCVHALLRRAELSHLIKGAENAGEELAEQHSETQPADRADLVTVSDAAKNRERGTADFDANNQSRPIESELEELHARRSREGGGTAEDSEEPDGSERRASDVGEAEVICIIRPLDKPNAASRVVVINRASSKFVGYLTGEIRRQPKPTTMRSISFDPCAENKPNSLHRRTAETDAANGDLPEEFHQSRIARRPDMNNPIPATTRRTGNAAEKTAAAEGKVAGESDDRSVRPRRYRRSPESR